MRSTFGGEVFDELIAALLADAALEVDQGSVVARAVRGWLRAGLGAWAGGFDAIVDVVLERLDEAVATQVEAILHNPLFRGLEGTWRGLKFVIDRVDKHENLKCEILNCSKDDLLADFEDAPEVPKSGLFRQVYSAEYGPFGGRPFAAVFANYEFGPGPQDMSILKNCGHVARRAALVFVTGAAPLCLAVVKNLDQLAEKGVDNLGPAHSKWHAVRGTPDARFVLLLLGRSLARAPYPSSFAVFARRGERVASDDDLVWQHPSCLVAALIARSFATYRLGCHVAGEVSGRLEGLPTYRGRALESRLPAAVVAAAVEAGVAAFEPADEGSVVLSRAPLWMSADAPDWASPRFDPASVAANCSLSGLMLVTRFVQACKVIQREQIGSWKERAVLESELQEWLHAYVAPAPRVLSETDEGVEAQLLARVRGAPTDPEPKLVYADWLEARGQSREAEWVRLSMAPPESYEVLSERRAALDEAWFARWQDHGNGTRAVLSAASIAVRDTTPGWYPAEFELTTRGASGPVKLVGETLFDRE
ncbi:MAG: type VI secretion system contractile sheath large subunit [Polyangiaceae bacterium]